eukprot:Hpha_TRINITY_DN18625_c0_g1::TRINITY_DN18625_c0_g1_i1::g.115602::m.115602
MDGDLYGQNYGGGGAYDGSSAGGSPSRGRYGNPGYSSPDTTGQTTVHPGSTAGSAYSRPSVYQRSMPTPGSPQSPPRRRNRGWGSPTSPTGEKRGKEGRRFRGVRDATASESLIAEEKGASAYPPPRKAGGSDNNWAVAGMLAGGLCLGAVVGGYCGWLIGHAVYGTPGYYAVHHAAATAATPGGMTKAAAAATHAANHAVQEKASAAAITSMTVPPTGVEPAAAAALSAHNAASATAAKAAISAFDAAGAPAASTPVIYYTTGVGAGSVAAGAAVGGAGGAVTGVSVAERRQALKYRRASLAPPVSGEVSRAG